MSTTRSLEGKVAIITGSARNMGRAFAQALARLGADITIHHHGPTSKSEAEETARLVQEQGTRTLVVEGDLADLAIVRQLFDKTLKTFGRVDIVLNNAGVIVKKSFLVHNQATFLGFSTFLG